MSRQDDPHISNMGSRSIPARAAPENREMHPVLKRNFEVLSALDWLAALTAYFPNAGEHLVRHYN